MGEALELTFQQKNLEGPRLIELDSGPLQRTKRGGRSRSSLRWVLAQMPRAIRTRLRPATHPSGMIDSQGEPLEIGVTHRLNRIIGSSYQPHPLDAPGVLVRATLASEEMPGHDSSNGWGALFTPGLEVIQANGNHSSIISNENNLAELGEQINAVLDRREPPPSQRRCPLAASV